MKKGLCLTIAAMLIMLGCAVALVYGNRAAVAYGNKDILRLHVIANSDSVFDQNAKLAVRDALLEVEKDGLSGAQNALEAKEIVMADADKMLAAARAALSELGADYSVRLSVGDYMFPERTYKDRKYPEGMYSALRVAIGEGAGHNWWCVMFPPLCIIDIGDGRTASLDPNEMSSLVVKLIKGIDGGKLWAWIEKNWQW